MMSMSDAKELFGLLKKGATLDQEKKILELELMINELKNENLELKREVDKLKAQAEADAQMVYKTPYYFKIIDNDENDGPFCQRCWDDEKKQIRLQTGTVRGHWHCTKCDKSFTDSSYSTPRPPNRQGGWMSR